MADRVTVTKAVLARDAERDAAGRVVGIAGVGIAPCEAIAVGPLPTELQLWLTAEIAAPAGGALFLALTEVRSHTDCVLASGVGGVFQIDTGGAQLTFPIYVPVRNEWPCRIVLRCNAEPVWQQTIFFVAAAEKTKGRPA